MPLILEALVTTLDPAGQVHIAPMGPRVDAALRRFELRPFPTSQTYRNLCAHGEGVIHITDDVLLLAQAALGPVEPLPALRPAERVRGFILADACRYFEFRVRAIDDSEERVRIETEIVQTGRLRDFLGFNRAKHAVVEAAILASRVDFLPLAEIQAEFRRLAVIVHKTGGDQEQQAFAFLQAHLDRVTQLHDQAQQEPFA
ncbi:MAG: DUF447 domain-containing protein [Gemmataceae bacterium]